MGYRGPVVVAVGVVVGVAVGVVVIAVVIVMVIVVVAVVVAIIIDAVVVVGCRGGDNWWGVCEMELLALVRLEGAELLVMSPFLSLFLSLCLLCLLRH